MDELDNVLRLVDGGSTTLSTDDSMTLLTKLRKSRLNRPDVVYKYGTKLLDKGAVTSGEVWSLYEQVLIAALQLGDVATAKRYVKKLSARFDVGEERSSRVEKLRAMILEAETQSPTAALEKYDEILKLNPANLPVLKRKAALLRSHGKYPEAASAFGDIIQLFGSDVQTWGELAEMHLELGDLQSAAFCLEELVLLNPMCVAYHTRLAEVYYSQDTTETLLKARKHYTMSLNTQAANLNKRALYGLAATCERLVSVNDWAGLDGKHETAVCKQLLSWVVEQVSEGHSDKATEIVGTVGRILSGHWKV
jgi:ER membrane protein complex subunit 2